MSMYTVTPELVELMLIKLRPRKDYQEAIGTVFNEYLKYGKPSVMAEAKLQYIYDQVLEEIDGPATST